VERLRVKLLARRAVKDVKSLARLRLNCVDNVRSDV